MTQATNGVRLQVAVAHDWLNQAGGAEVVLDELHALYPAAPIYTTIMDRTRMSHMADWDVRPSWMDGLPGILSHHQLYLPLYPLTWSRTRISGVDVVLSNKSAFVLGVDTPAAHGCYCLTPTRFVWEPATYIRHEQLPPGAGIALRLLLPWLQHWERSAARRVTLFAAISTTVQERIQRFYGRDSRLIYPPVDLRRFEPSSAVGDYYLILARLVPYKEIDLAVRAFSEMGRRLVVVGDGRDESRLRGMAGPSVEFRGRLPTDEVTDLLSRCRALVWPGVEDYGLAPVEAMASGRPVIARRAGGVLDTVVHGETGVFFDPGEPSALAAAVREADTIAWQPERIRSHAEQFGLERFRFAIQDFVAAVAERGPARMPGGVGR